MNPIFDAIFNTEDWIEESIKVGELGIEMLEDIKKVSIKKSRENSNFIYGVEDRK